MTVDSFDQIDDLMLIDHWPMAMAMIDWPWPLPWPPPWLLWGQGRFQAWARLNTCTRVSGWVQPPSPQSLPSHISGICPKYSSVKSAQDGERTSSVFSPQSFFCKQDPLCLIVEHIFCLSDFVMLKVSSQTKRICTLNSDGYHERRNWCHLKMFSYF